MAFHLLRFAPGFLIGAVAAFVVPALPARPVALSLLILTAAALWSTWPTKAGRLAEYCHCPGCQATHGRHIAH